MTNWQYSALHAALSGMEALSDADAAAALAAQAVSVVRDVPTVEARKLTFTTAEWSAIVRRAAAAERGDTDDQASVLAITVRDVFLRTETLDTTEADAWASIQQMAGALAAAGIISEATAAKLLSLRTLSRPAWDPLPTAQDVAHARSMGG